MREVESKWVKSVIFRNSKMLGDARLENFGST